MGDIEVKNLKWGPFSIPLSIKVWCSAFLILPMYIWINFKENYMKKSRHLRASNDGQLDVGKRILLAHVFFAFLVC